MTRKRAWICLPDQTMEEVPPPFLEYAEILWPPTMPEKKPGEPVQYFTPNDLYHRYAVVAGEVYVFVHNSQLEGGKVPPEVLLWVWDRIESSGPLVRERDPGAT